MPAPVTHHADLSATPWGHCRPPTWQRWDTVGLPTTVDFDLALLTTEYPDLAGTVQQHLPLLERAIDRYGPVHAVQAFLADADHLDLYLDRRALVILLAYLSEFAVPPRLPVQPGSRHHKSNSPRPLRPLEVAAVRAAGDDPTRFTLLRLLAAGATSTEAARLRVDAVEVHPERLVVVQLPGGRRRRPWTVALAPGAARDIDRLRRHSQDGYLMPLSSSDRPNVRVKAANEMARRLLHIIGLSDDATVTPTSIRLAGLAAIHDTFGLAAAAAADNGTLDHRCLHQQLHPSR